jgi:acetyltransferase
MTIRNLDKLLAPQLVALIGASAKLGSIGRIVAKNMFSGGFGLVWLVTRRHEAIEVHPASRLSRICRLLPISLSSRLRHR